MTQEIGAMYGPDNVSEAAQAERMIHHLPSHALVLAESRFDIFRVAYNCQSLGKEFVFRLTADRFKSYQKNATQVKKAADSAHGNAVAFSSKDRFSNPYRPPDALIKVFVHQITLDG